MIKRIRDSLVLRFKSTTSATACTIRNAPANPLRASRFAAGACSGTSQVDISGTCIAACHTGRMATVAWLTCTRIFLAMTLVSQKGRNFCTAISWLAILDASMLKARMISNANARGFVSMFNACQMSRRRRGNEYSRPLITTLLNDYHATYRPAMIDGWLSKVTEPEIFYNHRDCCFTARRRSRYPYETIYNPHRGGVAKLPKCYFATSCGHVLETVSP